MSVWYVRCDVRACSVCVCYAVCECMSVCECEYVRVCVLRVSVR